MKKLKNLSLILFVLLATINMALAQPPLESSPRGKEGEGKEWCYDEEDFTISIFSYYGLNENLELVSISWNGEPIDLEVNTTVTLTEQEDYQVQYNLTFPEPVESYGGLKGLKLQVTFLWWPPNAEEPELITLPVSIYPCNVTASEFGGLDSTSRRSKSVTVYPNPVSTFCELTVDLKDKKLQRIDVLDRSGRSLKSVSYENRGIENTLFSDKFDMVEFPAGMYFIQVVTNRDVMTYQLIKQ